MRASIDYSRRLPHRPQTVDQLRERFARAIREPIDCDAAARGETTPPGARPENVFDFASGLRLIVSLDVFSGWSCPKLHLSASAEEGSGLYRSLASRVIDPARFERLVLDAYRSISGDEGPLELVGYGVTGVPHWMRDAGPGDDVSRMVGGPPDG